jgi:NUDIX domain
MRKSGEVLVCVWMMMLMSSLPGRAAFQLSRSSGSSSMSVGPPLFLQRAACFSQTHRQHRMFASSKDYLATTTPPIVIPRAAVSVCVRCRVVTCREQQQQQHSDEYYYLLVQRGKEPNKGMWSLPGGKVEYGEKAVAAAKRELSEETLWMSSSSQGSSDDHDLLAQLQWYDGTVTTTDSIGDGFHYLIAHCFAELLLDNVPVESSSSSGPPKMLCYLPQLQAADDAADADWFTTLQIQAMNEKTVTPGLLPVIQRVEELSRAGMLLPP